MDTNIAPHRALTQEDVLEWVSFATNGSRASYERMAKALMLRYGNESELRPFEEIAETLGVSPVGAYQYVRRGLALLRTAPRFHRMEKFPGITETRLWRAVHQDYLPEVREN